MCLPIELERCCGSSKIWTTKVKRLRLPDLLCVKIGMRAEVRAKTDLKIRMSDAPANPDRVWDAGQRDDDIVAVITCFDGDDGPEPADDAVCFTVGALRVSVDRSKLGPPKSASEGAERDRTWPATVPTRDGTVLEEIGRASGAAARAVSVRRPVSRPRVDDRNSAVLEVRAIAGRHRGVAGAGDGGDLTVRLQDRPPHGAA